MSQGFLLFAHNNGEVDYLKLAQICAKRIRKYYDNVLIALVTDEMFESDDFDYVISTDIDKDNKRTLNNRVQYFHNTSRLDAFRLSPFDETIVIDVDYIVNSNLLGNYFGSQESFLMGTVNNFYDDQEPVLRGMPMKWATTLYFKKDNIAKAIFNQATLVKENYSFYKNIYYFTAQNFRNDYAFTIAEHIVKGMSSSVSMPKINFLASSQDEILEVKGDRFVCLIDNLPCVFTGTDLHFFNKQTIFDFEKDLI
jgi:hypothetical protein